MKFDNLAILHLLWVVPVLVAVYAYGFHKKWKALRTFATFNLLDRLIPEVSFTRQKIKAALVLAAIALLVIGATGPRWGKDVVDVQRRGIDIIVALDVSRSMLAEDIAPNRLERSKIELTDMLGVMRGDRVGLVTFAGKPVLTCPLTINYGAYRMALREVDTKSSPVGGSLIGDAVRVAVQSFTDNIKAHKAILLITDGEDQQSLPVEAARNAFEEHGIRVFTVGLGDMTEGTRIPVTDENGQTHFLQHGGQEVWSKMNPAVLQEMALEGGGIYFPAGTRDIDFAEIYERIREKIEAREFETSRKELYHAQFQWFAGAALLLLLIEVVMTDRKAAAAAKQSEYRAAA